MRLRSGAAGFEIRPLLHATLHEGAADRVTAIIYDLIAALRGCRADRHDCREQHSAP
jgi:hypothetical protein